MPPRKIYHVLPHPAGWAVKIGKAKRASAVTPTKAGAVKAASGLAKSSPKSQVVIRKSTGRFKGDRTYEVSAYRKKRRCGPRWPRSGRRRRGPSDDSNEIG